MNAAKVRELSDSELLDKETELAERLFTLRLQKVTGQLEKPSTISETKRDLARVLTVRKERALSARSES